ncbi:MAG: Fe-S cluster assembly protein SufD [Luteimonas sp.]
MSALLDSLAAGFEGNAEQRDALDAALGDGLPGARSEAWKYTSLRALERRTFTPAVPALAAIDPELLTGIPAPRLVFINGRFDLRHSDTSGVPAGVELHAAGPGNGVIGTIAPHTPSQRGRNEAVFARLNAFLANDGVVLRVGESVRVDAPIHLVFVGVPTGQDVASHSHHLIELGAGAQLWVIEHHINAGEHAHLGNVVTRVAVADKAHLLHARIQCESAGATLMARTNAVLAADAYYQRLDLELGGGLSRHELNVRLDGIGARLLADGVLLATGRRHLDTRLAIEHVARDSMCDLFWRGLAADRGRVVFHGGIVIHPDADGSDARLSNKNLLLSDAAEIDTQPVLEIHADEVKAAHGATVGQLDPIAMFYLRSRGLPEDVARRLLTTAFCREALARIESDVMRETLAEALDAALARIDTA